MTSPAQFNGSHVVILHEAWWFSCASIQHVWCTDVTPAHCWRTSSKVKVLVAQNRPHRWRITVFWAVYHRTAWHLQSWFTVWYSDCNSTVTSLFGCLEMWQQQSDFNLHVLSEITDTEQCRNQEELTDDWCCACCAHQGENTNPAAVVERHTSVPPAIMMPGANWWRKWWYSVLFWFWGLERLSFPVHICEMSTKYLHVHSLKIKLWLNSSNLALLCEQFSSKCLIRGLQPAALHGATCGWHLCSGSLTKTIIKLNFI